MSAGAVFLRRSHIRQFPNEQIVRDLFLAAHLQKEERHTRFRTLIAHSVARHCSIRSKVSMIKSNLRRSHSRIGLHRRPRIGNTLADDAAGDTQ